MARSTETITKTTVAKVLRSLAKSNQDYEIGDTKTRGLCIRVRKISATWALRCRIGPKQTIVTIGAVQALQDPDFVRQLAEKGKSRARAGEDPKPLFEAAIEASSTDHAEAIERAAAGEEWTWDQLVQKYLDLKKETRRRQTWRSYKSSLRHHSTSPLRGMLLSQITPDDVRRVRENLERLGKPRQFSSTMQIVNSALVWACDQSGSGLRDNPARFIKTTATKKSLTPQDALRDLADGRRAQYGIERTLTERELGLLLWEVQKIPNASFRQLIELEIFTAQRRWTVVSAIKGYFSDDAEFGLLWDIHPGMSKVERGRELPIIGRAREAFQRAKLLSSDASPWLFPQQKKQKATDAGGGHMSEQNANRILKKLQAPGMPLHSNKPFSPHAFRRSFITYTSKMGFPEHQRALVTHDAEGKHSVHERFYNADQKLPAKTEILTAWHNFVVRLMNEHNPELADWNERMQWIADDMAASEADRDAFESGADEVIEPISYPDDY